MRNNPALVEATMLAKDAAIYWGTDQVVVTQAGQPVPLEADRLRYSGGALYAVWRKNCKDQEKAMILCLRLFWDLVYTYEIDPEIVDKALSMIVEYQEAFQIQSGSEAFG